MTKLNERFLKPITELAKDGYSPTVDLHGARLINVGEGLSSSDFVTKDYVDSSDKVNGVTLLRSTASYIDSKVVSLTYHTTVGDNGGGEFYWDATSTEADNNGTVFQVTGVTTGRWKRKSNHSKNWVDVSWFGTVGDGITDDTSKFVSALAYLKTLNKKTTLFISAGRYKVSPASSNYGCISVDFDGLRITGEGDSSEILVTSNTHVPIHVSTQQNLTIAPSSTIQDFECDHIKITGTGTYEYFALAFGRGILVRSGIRANIHNTTVVGMSMIGICTEGGNGYFRVYDNIITNCKFTAINFNGRCYNSVVRGNIISGTDGDINAVAIQVDGPCIVTNNTIYGHATNYANAGGIMFGEGSWDGIGQITNNYISHTRYGIKSIYHGSCNISGNTLVNCLTTGGIQTIGGTGSGFTVETTHQIISNNLVINCYPYQIEAGTVDTLVSGNICRKISSPTLPSALSEPDGIIVATPEVGIILENTRIACVGNIIDGAQRGLVSLLEYPPGVISGNTISNCNADNHAQSTISYNYVSVPNFERVNIGSNIFVNYITSPTLPTTGYYPAGSVWRTSVPSGISGISSYIVIRNQATTVGTLAGGLSPTVSLNASITPKAGTNTYIGIVLDNNTFHWTYITAVSGAVATLASPIPSGRNALVGALVYIVEWTNPTNEIKGVALLRTSPGLISLGNVTLAYHTTDGYGGGELYWDGYSTEADNNGTVFQVTGITTGRWKRPIKETDIEGTWFGMVPGTNQNISTILSSMQSSSSLPDGLIIHIRGRYKLNTTFTLTKNWIIQGDGNTNLPTTPAGTILDIAPTITGAAVIIQASGAQIRDLVIHGPMSGGVIDPSYGNYDGLVMYANGTTAKHVSVFYAGNDGIRVGGTTGAPNCNSINLLYCVTIWCRHDGIHVEHPSDANGCTIDSCVSRLNGHHGFYNNNGVNSFIGCLAEGNTLDGINFGSVANTSLISGGDYEANGSSNVYLDPGGLYNTINLPYQSSRRFDLDGTTNPYVGNAHHWQSKATYPMEITDFRACLGHEITVYLNQFTTLKHSASLQLANGFDVVGSNVTGRTRTITLKKVDNGSVFVTGPWVEISRNFDVQSDPAQTMIDRVGYAPHILMPLKNDFKNYGFSSGELQRIGNPVLSKGALEFDGYNDAAFIPQLYSLGYFTLVCAIRWDTWGSGSITGSLISIDNSMPGVETGYKGYAAAAYNGKFRLVVNGIQMQDTGFSVTNDWQVVTITRAVGTGTKMYIDGYHVTPIDGAGAVGTGVVMGAEFVSTWINFIKGAIKNLVVFNQELSDQERYIAENWALEDVTATALTSYLITASNDKISGFGIGADIDGYSGSVLNSWPSRIGSPMNYLDSNRFSVGTINGRKCLTNSSNNSAILVSTQASHANEFWVVAKAASVPPGNYYGAMTGQTTPSASPQRSLLTENGTSTWYAAGGSNWYRDGYATNVIDTNLHIYSGQNAANAENSIVYVGNDFGAVSTRAWRGDIAAWITVSGTLTAAERAGMVSILKSYFKI